MPQPKVSPTGRLTKSEPEIQNIPVRTPEGSALIAAALSEKFKVKFDNRNPKNKKTDS